MSNHPEPTSRNVGDRMQALAAQFVEAAKAAGVALDYLPRTLPIAEKFAKGAGADPDHMAAYFGEVIRRETRGFWYDSNGIAMLYAGIEPYVDPDAIVQSMIKTGRADAAGMPVESWKGYCDFISRTQRLWLDEAVLGSYPSMSVLRTSMAADAKTAGMVLALSQQAVLTAQLDWSESISVSEDSLDAVERILGTMHKLSKTEPHRITPELIDSVSKSMGVHIGEVIRRQFGGQWRTTEAGSFEIPYPGTTIDPIGRARKRILDGPSENIKMYFSSMHKVIAS
jgi:hypothetical protein